MSTPETEQVGPHDVHLLPNHPDYRDHVACRACGTPSRPSIERGLWEERCEIEAAESAVCACGHIALDHAWHGCEECSCGRSAVAAYLVSRPGQQAPR